MNLSLLPIETERLRLRNWQISDSDLFYEINSHPEAMEFFHFRRNQSEAQALMLRLQDDITRNGFGFAAVVLKSTNQPIGFCGLVKTHMPGIFEANTVEIGWRLARSFWSKGYASEAARAWLDIGFNQLGLTEIVSFAVKTNQNSLRVMQKIGMIEAPSQDFDDAEVPETYPHLKPHAVYKITKTAWENKI